MGNMSQKIMEQHLGIFDVWMQQESNLIQEVARSFGEVMCLEYFVNDILKNADSSIK